jgi:hypothetical protein
MVARSTPASRNRKLNVPKTNNKGSPAENPRAIILRLEALRYQRRLTSQEVFCSALRPLCGDWGSVVFIKVPLSSKLGPGPLLGGKARLKFFECYKSHHEFERQKYTHGR